MFSLYRQGLEISLLVATLWNVLQPGWKVGAGAQGVLLRVKILSVK